MVILDEVTDGISPSYLSGVDNSVSSGSEEESVVTVHDSTADSERLLVDLAHRA